MVETWHISSVLATALSLVVAFFARFLFHSLVVYAPRRRREEREAAGEPEPDTATLRIIRAHRRGGDESRASSRRSSADR
ncbi:hypothetical protein AB1285_19700 [Microbacterium sp. NRRL B-14842]|uniref:hypothetical protein n=1 Tax=Microbacterium sp. NRRL B-14842 TaxID=3162881 RepID=UPI003D28DC4F